MKVRHLLIMGVLIWCGSVVVAPGATCTVPSGSYPTIASAVANLGCTEITVQAGSYQENLTIGRSLSLTGVSASATTIVGQVRVEGAATLVALDALAVDAADPAVAGCFTRGIDATGGARVAGSGIVVTNATGIACLLFGDDFESGTTGAWSATVP
jgi:hypothetical protein